MTAADAQKIADDVLAAGALVLGPLAPPVALGLKVAEALTDAGFAVWFAAVRAGLEGRAVEQSAGVAAAASAAATTVMERERGALLICGDQLPHHMGRAYHGLDCAAVHGCGKEIEAC